jgi:hypothetical protein
MFLKKKPEIGFSSITPQLFSKTIDGFTLKTLGISFVAQLACKFVFVKIAYLCHDMPLMVS